MKKPHNILSILTVAARLLLGGIFLFAGVPKIFSPDEFAETIFNYQILPDLLINPVAIILPWIETVTGIFLIAGIWMPGSVLLVNLMLAVFLAATVFNYSRGLDIDCGCFSVGNGERIGPMTILRDSVFLLTAIFLLYATARKSKPGRRL